MDVKLYNTLTRKKEIFTPLESGVVSLYSCGPTVYDYAHIGNLRSYVFADILRRVFEYNGYKVTQVINITDVGHLTSDEDEGADKLEESARKAGKSAQEIAEFYTESFFKDLTALDIDIKNIIFPKATEHIAEQVALIEKLEKKGFTYQTSDGVYFDTSKLSDYGKLARLDIEGLKAGARVEATGEKKNITDFALWKLSPLGGKAEEKRQQQWESPWGVGFPGWHLECSAMSMKYLGEHFDVHTGGIDHIPVHHTNEIAQSQSATGKPFVNYWMHNEFVNVDGEKMSKSLGNIITLTNVIEKGFSPLAYRYWLLTAHYRTLVNFTWEALGGAQTALDKLHNHFLEYGNDIGEVNVEYKEKFTEYINDDLNTPKAIALLWELVKDRIVSEADKKATMLDFDRVLGLGFEEVKPEEVPKEILKLVEEREEARETKDWAKSDVLREEIHKKGFEVLDTDDEPRVRKI
jgi:cysteinyl-tRNA synthetase